MARTAKLKPLVAYTPLGVQHVNTLEASLVRADEPPSCIWLGRWLWRPSWFEIESRTLAYQLTGYWGHPVIKLKGHWPWISVYKESL